MNIVRYLSSAVVKKFKKNSISDTSKILGGTADTEPEQNPIDSFYHS